MTSVAFPIARPAASLAALSLLLASCSGPAADPGDSVAKAEAAAQRAELAAQRAEKAAKFISTTGLTAAPEPEAEPLPEPDPDAEMRPAEDNASTE